MAKIEREITHHMSLERAKSIAETIMGKLQTHFGSMVSEIKWNDDKSVADVKGKGFTGQLSVNDTTAKIVLELGLAASLFKGKVESEVDEYAKAFTDQPADDTDTKNA